MKSHITLVGVVTLRIMTAYVIVVFRSNNTVRAQLPGYAAPGDSLRNRCQK